MRIASYQNNMIKILRNGVILLVTTVVIAGCVKKIPSNKAAVPAAAIKKQVQVLFEQILDSPDPEPIQKAAEPILWGAETAGSLFLDPMVYQRQDPLGKLEQFIGYN